MQYNYMIVTTNIRLPKEQLKALKMRAIEVGTSVSELLRRAVQQLLRAGEAPKKSGRTNGYEKNAIDADSGSFKPEIFAVWTSSQ